MIANLIKIKGRFKKISVEHNRKFKGRLFHCSGAATVRDLAFKIKINTFEKKKKKKKKTR